MRIKYRGCGGTGPVYPRYKRPSHDPEEHQIWTLLSRITSALWELFSKEDESFCKDKTSSHPFRDNTCTRLARTPRRCKTCIPASRGVVGLEFAPPLTCAVWELFQTRRIFLPIQDELSSIGYLHAPYEIRGLCPMSTNNSRIFWRSICFRCSLRAYISPEGASGLDFCSPKHLCVLGTFQRTCVLCKLFQGRRTVLSRQDELSSFWQKRHVHSLSVHCTSRQQHILCVRV